MKTFTIEITKTIVVDVEAASYKDVCRQIENDQVPDLGKNWTCAESKIALLKESCAMPTSLDVNGDVDIIAVSCFDGPLVLFDHGHIKTSEHAALFKTGEIALPGTEPEFVAVRHHNFQFNAMQKRDDAVFEVFRGGVHAGYYFASTFKSLCL